jgi:hypothetical protein
MLVRRNPFPVDEEAMPVQNPVAPFREVQPVPCHGVAAPNAAGSWLESAIQ